MRVIDLQSPSDAINEPVATAWMLIRALRHEVRD
jgi:hypothetical protein